MLIAIDYASFSVPLRGTGNGSKVMLIIDVQSYQNNWKLVIIYLWLYN